MSAKHNYRLRRKSGSDKGRPPIFADNPEAATGMARMLADGWASTILFEQWNHAGQRWETIDSFEPTNRKEQIPA